MLAVASKTLAWLRARPTIGVVAGMTALYALYFCTLFVPALRDGRLIAPGDASGQYIPQFLAPTHAWEPSLLAGFPLHADPQNATWYPLRWLLHPFAWSHPLVWNVYVIGHLVLAAMLAWRYALELTEDRQAAAVGGLLYGGCGFLVRNGGETPILASAAWAPLVFLAIERLRKNRGPSAIVLGAIGIACSLLAGHPQVFVYTCAVAAAYAVFNLRWAEARGRYAASIAALFAIGLAAASVQILATSEVTGGSTRTDLAYVNFVGWSWRLKQGWQLLVPTAFWGKLSTIGRSPRCMLDPSADSAYAGLAGLILASVGATHRVREPKVWFWLGAMAFSLAFAFGDTPLAKVLFHVPGYRLFQVPVRHMYFFSLGVCVLGAYGVVALKRTLARISTAIAVAVVALGLFVADRSLLASECIVAGSAPIRIATGVLVVVAVALAARLARPDRWATAAGLFVAAGIDLGSFGPYLDWRPDVYAIYARDLIRPSEMQDVPPGLAALQPTLSTQKQRIWPVDGALAGHDEGIPNRSMLWNVPSASGYFPLAPRSVTELLEMRPPAGNAVGPWWASENHALDVAAVRYVTAPSIHLNFGGMWRPGELGVALSRHHDHETMKLERTTPVYGFAMVASLKFAVGLPLGTPLATVDLGPRRETLTYGGDIIDEATTCFLPNAPRGSAQRLLWLAVELEGKPCLLETFRIEHRFTEPVDASALDFDWLIKDLDSLLEIHQLTLLDRDGEAAYPVDGVRLRLAQDAERWTIHDVDEPGSSLSLYENRRALPRARWADRVAKLASAGEELWVVHYGHLPGGAPYEPAHTALTVVDQPFDAAPEPDCGAKNALTWRRDDPDSIALDVDAEASCVLVVADTFYPGWHARIDGHDAAIHRVDHAFRGIFVPRGARRITFDYVPTTRWLGVLLAGSAVLVSAVLLAWSRRQRLAGTMSKFVSS